MISTESSVCACRTSIEGIDAAEEGEEKSSQRKKPNKHGKKKGKEAIEETKAEEG